MILKYTITDNRLIKENPTDYPSHLQDNIVLQFDDKDNILNDKSYAYIKTHDKVEKAKIISKGGVYSCKLPLFVTMGTFFALRVLIIIDEQKMFTNELIVPIRVHDYLDYNRTIAHSRKKNRKHKKHHKHKRNRKHNKHIVERGYGEYRIP